MPKALLSTIAVIFLSIFVSIAKATLFPPTFESISYEVREIELEQLKLKSNTPPKIKIKDHDAFLNDIGFRESSNRYHITNKYGYMGKYQFGMKTLKSLGIKTTKKEFLNNPELQEKAMLLLLKDNKRILKRFIKKYEGKYLHGIYITESGVLAASHLGGAGNVKKWFRKGEVFRDAIGTSITSYMKQFSGYNLDV